MSRNSSQLAFDSWIATISQPPGAGPALVQLGPPVGKRDGFLVVHPDLARVARVRVVMAFLVGRFAASDRVFAGADPPAAVTPAAPRRRRARKR